MLQSFGSKRPLVHHAALVKWADFVEKLGNSTRSFSREIPLHLKTPTYLRSAGRQRSSHLQADVLAEPLAKFFDWLSVIDFSPDFGKIRLFQHNRLAAAIRCTVNKFPNFPVGSVCRCAQSHLAFKT